MGPRSVFANVMLFLIAMIMAIGFYLTIGAVDVFRQREETLVKEVQGMRSEISRLRTSVESGGMALARPDSDATARPRPALARFANEDLRAPNAVEGDQIIMATASETANMNYFINNEAQVGDYWGLCNDSLAARSYKNPDDWQPQLAESWEISPDKRTFTIHLRKGVLWHNFTDPTTGKRHENVEVTAEDFKFFVDVVRNEKIPCDFLRVYYKDLDDLKVRDRYTFQVVWKEPYFMAVELTLGLNPLPKHFYQFNPEKPEEFTDNTERNRMIVGCGPWKFYQWEKDKQIEFQRNEDYYGPKPCLKRMVFRVIKEPNARFQALKNGELDRIGLMPQQWLEQSSDPAFLARFDKFRYPARQFSYIGYNMRREPFKDARVRVALTHLVDRPRIVKEVYSDLARPVTCPFFIDSPSYDKTIEPYPFDIAKGKALLAEAGWKDTDGDGILDKDGKKFEFVFLAVTNNPIQARIADIVRDDFAKAGIVVNINPIEWSIYTQRLDERNFDVCSLGWALGWDQDPYQIWFSTEADNAKGSNHVGFKNKEADDIILAARREFDPVKRADLYHRLDRIIHAEQPYTFLVAPDALVTQDNRYQNAKVYPLGMDINTFWVPTERQKYRE